MSLEYMTIIFFLTILILLSKIKDIILKEDKRSYKYISGGIFLMALMSLLDIYNTQGLFHRTPFMSAEIFFRVFIWIGNIVGIVLLLNGLSSWLPISKTYRKITKENLVRFDIVKKIDQLLNVESRIYQVIKSTVNQIVNDFELASGAIYLFSQSKESTKLINTTNTTSSLEETLVKFESDKEFYSIRDNKNNLKSFIDNQFRNNNDRPVIVHQLQYKDKTFGVILLWGNKSADRILEIEKVIKVIFDLITSRIHLRISLLKDDFNQLNEKVNLETLKLLNDNNSLKNIIPSLFQSIKQLMDISFVSVVEVNGNKAINRFSVGTSNTILHEQNINMNYDAGVWGYVRNSGDIYYDFNVDSMSYDAQEEIYSSGNVQSIVALPIKQNENCKGMIVISSKNNNGLKIKEVKILSTISNLLAVLLLNEKKSEFENKQSVTALDTFNFAETYHSLKDESMIFTRSARYLFDTLTLSVIRIFLFDDDKLFGSSKALLYQQDLDVVTPGGGSLILSMLPLHNQARQSGEITIFGTDQNSEMTKVESSQVLSKMVKSGMIIPLKNGVDIVGLISIGDTTRRSYSANDQELGKLIADKISESLQANILKSRIEKHVKILNLQTTPNKQEFDEISGLEGTVDYNDEKVLTR